MNSTVCCQTKVHNCQYNCIVWYFICMLSNKSLQLQI